MRRSLIIAALVIGIGLSLTSSEPWVETGAPTAEQASAARAGVLAFRAIGESETGVGSVTLSQNQLAAISALASEGLRPDRLRVAVRGDTLVATASRPLPGGRWLNFRAAFLSASRGFPSPRLSIGALTLPPGVGLQTVELARGIVRLRGADLPPLDDMVRAVKVNDGTVRATLHLPRRSGVLDSLATIGSPIEPSAVRRAYCALAAMQRARPRDDFAVQVRRAFAPGPAAGSPGGNGAALVALAMLVGDERAGYLSGVTPGDVHSCRIDIVVTTLHGRADLPRHWALSAAIAATQGAGLARAVGEWKELADTLANPADFAAGDPSGFSFVDLAADRAGFRTARAALLPATARATAERLAAVTVEQLMPVALLEEPDGLTGREFERRFGGLDADRYKAAVATIDAVLAVPPR